MDPKTGSKTIDPALVPGDGRTKTICPHAGAAKSWLPSSYNPATKIIYIPLVESCMDLMPVGEGEHGFLSIRGARPVRPGRTATGKFGRLEAMTWRPASRLDHRQRAPTTTGALATAGEIIFVGSLDRVLLRTMQGRAVNCGTRA